MKSTIRHRSLVATAAILGCVALMTIPASATAFVPYNVTTGVVEADVDGPTGPIQPQIYDLADPTVTHPCAPTTPTTPDVQVTTNADSWTIGTELTDASFDFAYFNLSNSTRNYRFKLTHITGSGLIGDEPGNTKSVSGTAVVHADITASATTSSTDCGFTSTGIGCLTMTAFTEVSGEYHVEDSGETVTADTYTVDLVAAGLVFTGACSPPFATLEDNGTFSVEDLTLCNPAANTDGCLID